MYCASNDWRRKSPDTNKETKEMESRKRQRKGNGHGLLFFQVFLLYFTLVSSFLSYILPVYCQKIKKLVAGAPDGGKKRQRKLSGHRPTYYAMLLFLQLFLLYFTLRIS